MNNYPAGAEHDPRAPYNQRDPEEVNIDITTSVTLSRTMPETTLDYEATEDFDEIDDEDSSGNLRRRCVPVTTIHLDETAIEKEYTDRVIPVDKLLVILHDIALGKLRSFDGKGRALNRVEAKERRYWEKVRYSSKDWVEDESEIIIEEA